MTPTIGLFHATVNAIQPMVDAWRMSGHRAGFRHYVDEGMLPLVGRHGATSPAVLERLRGWLTLIDHDGATAVLTTCSSLTPAVAHLRPAFPRPLVAIDEAMIDEALGRATRIGLVATLPGAAATTRALLEAAGQAASRPPAITTAVAEGAFDALSRGDTAAHDRATADAARSLVSRVDLIVLAQISMMRALPALAELPVPVLASAPGAIRRVLDGIERANREAP